jgi:glyoxylase-like metal-dependent hydrolase (beta-lactamase superfamily II)
MPSKKNIAPTATDATLVATLVPPASGVAVRMYNTGFGDCFLLAFRSETGEARYVLIDCGVHQKWKGGKERLELVASDIAKATNNHLHVVAVTHEHTDHISGFLQGESSFGKMKIDNLWLAWTEDPSNPVAKQLKAQYGVKIRALRAAVSRLKLAGNPLGGRLEGILDFDLDLESDQISGQSPGHANGNAALASPSSVSLGRNANGLSAIRSWVDKKPERPEDYRTPGEAPLSLPGVKGVKCYVLGPPNDIESLKKLEGLNDTYLSQAAMDGDTAFMAAALAASESALSEDEDLIRRSNPFDNDLIIPENEADKHPKFGSFFAKHYGFSRGEKRDPEWRRIESDWLGAAGQIALSINSMTNNTSLVLAFELTETNPPKVLLFAGDAQVGNWKSWQKLTWQSVETGTAGAETDGRNGMVTGADLIARTVFYKVGHHGSRNATLREKGLEMMTSTELVAMIPVDEKWAKEVMEWDHPYEKLTARLMEMARGRVLRSDRIPEGGSMSKPKEATDKEWESFQKRLQWDAGQERLWIQYTVT